MISMLSANCFLCFSPTANDLKQRECELEAALLESKRDIKKTIADDPYKSGPQ
jgi:hypothetical protein